jgi:outer membrane immunogenic protein
MKYGVLGIAAVASLIATSGSAAPVSQIYSWTGFYVGGNVGYGWGSSSTVTSFENATTGALLSTDSNRFNMDGVIGGGQFGYNWQRDRLVFGFEADIQGSGQRGNSLFSCGGGSLGGAPPFSSACAPGHVGDTAPFDTPAAPVFDRLNQSLEWFGTVRGRIGGTVTPNILLFVTGGLAYGEVKSSIAVDGVNITGSQGTNNVILTPAGTVISGSSTRVGYTIGAGIEGAIGGNWTAKLEYLYIDLGTVSLRGITPILTTTPGTFLATNISSRVTDNILRVGVNYHFNGPVGP